MQHGTTNCSATLSIQTRKYAELTTPPLNSSPDVGLVNSTGSNSNSRQLIFNRNLKYVNNLNLKITETRQSWVENFDKLEVDKRGLIELHPRVFAAFPRPDIIQLNIRWQNLYKRVDWLSLKTKAEMPGSNRKPWPQKGTGRARHSGHRAPQWMNGGWCHGPRGPRTHFFMLQYFLRVRGLMCTLSAKFAQNDIKIVDTLEDFPSDDPKFLEQFIEKRQWGPSVLIVDKGDIFPQNIALAAEKINHINLMPLYGLNCFSMLKHETLVLTVAAVEELEEKLLFQFERTDLKNVIYKFKPPPIVRYHN